MTEAQIFGELHQIFAGIFKRSDIRLSTELSAHGVPGWDSLRFASVMVATEERFGIEIEPEDLEGVKRVRDLVKTIAENIPPGDRSDRS
jgi:acyl carrier protein